MSNKPILCAVERPIELLHHGKRIAAFLCTPKNLEELAVGHLLTRGLISRTSDILKLEADPEAGCVQIETTHPLGEELYSVPQFVVCGNATVDSFSQNIERIAPVKDGFTASLTDLQNLARYMVSHALLYEQTGGVHGAVLQNQSGTVYLREDIGRHSAVDKSIGAAALASTLFGTTVLCTTGRISLDMLLKSAAMGIPLVVSLKCPSDLALNLARRYNIAVVGHILTNHPTVYTAEHRIV